MRFLLGLLVALGLLGSAHAQTFTVASCPSVVVNGAAGQTGRAIAIDPNGNVCGVYGPSGTQNVNVAQVGGATTPVGHGVAATAMRVELPTDGTGVVGLNAGSAIVGKFGIDQTTPGTTNAVQANVASGGVASGAFASGALASGSVASGAVASGAYAAGSIGSGAMVDVGAIADAAATAGSTGSVNAKLRLVTSQIDTTNTDLGPPGATVCATDTGSCSLNALLQRIAQRLSTGITNQTNDPCAVGTKLSQVINVTSATTTQLVALNGSTIVYICGFTMSIASSAVSADTAAFVTGTGSSCGTGTTGLTGLFGSGTIVANATPTTISYGGGGQTVTKTTAGGAFCITSAGTTVNVQGMITYVQQ